MRQQRILLRRKCGPRVDGREDVRRFEGPIVSSGIVSKSAIAAKRTIHALHCYFRLMSASGSHIAWRGHAQCLTQITQRR